MASAKSNTPPATVAKDELPAAATPPATPPGDSSAGSSDSTAKAEAFEALSAKLHELEVALKERDEANGAMSAKLHELEVALKERDEADDRARRVAKRHPITRAVDAVLEARDCLLEAERARGKDDDSTADAGRLAAAIARFGGALAHEQEPWPIKHALDRVPGVTDPDGAGALERFGALIAASLRAGARRKSLGLGLQPGLMVFAGVAVKHATQRTAVDELHQVRRAEESARQRKHIASLGSRRMVGNSFVAPLEDEDDVRDEEVGDDAPRVG